MGPLDQRARALVEAVQKSTNPANRGLDVGVFVSRALEAKEISLYEAYQLTGMKMEFERLACVQPAWPDRVRITLLVELLNLRLLAALFGERAEEAHWLDYCREAYALNQEKRPHYILDRYPEFLEEAIPTRALEALRAVRSGRRKPFDKGPYHSDFFPGDRCQCEELLLRGETLSAEEKTLSETVEGLLVELALVLEEIS